MKLTDANKIRDYVKEQINPYGKPFDGSAYEFGLKLIKYLENMSTAYDIDKVVEELEEYLKSERNFNDIIDTGSEIKNPVVTRTLGRIEAFEEAIEIVKQGVVSDDVCEWKIDGVYLRSPHNQPFVTCIADDENYRYSFCPVCGKKIKAVE